MVFLLLSEKWSCSVVFFLSFGLVVEDLLLISLMKIGGNPFIQKKKSRVIFLLTWSIFLPSG